MNVLVTGATGFIGGRLLRLGGLGMARNRRAVGDFVIGDLLDPSSLRKACIGVESVFHCAGYAHVSASADPERHWQVNFEGTRNLVNAAGDAGVKCFVFLSSVKAMANPGDRCVDEDWPGEPTTAYGRSKRAAEDAVLEAGARFGMHVVNLRLAMVYGRGGGGNLERMAQGIRAGWFPRLPDTGNRRSLVHVDDVVAAIRLAASARAANGGTYIVADPRPYSGRELFDAINDALSQRVRWGLAESLLRARAVAGDRLRELTGCQTPLNSDVLERLLGSACYSPGRIRCALGWQAQVGLAEGVREMLGMAANEARV